MAMTTRRSTSKRRRASRQRSGPSGRRCARRVAENGDHQQPKGRLHQEQTHDTVELIRFSCFAMKRTSMPFSPWRYSFGDRHCVNVGVLVASHARGRVIVGPAAELRLGVNGAAKRAGGWRRDRTSRRAEAGDKEVAGVTGAVKGQAKGDRRPPYIARDWSWPSALGAESVRHGNCSLSGLGATNLIRYRPKRSCRFHRFNRSFRQTSQIAHPSCSCCLIGFGQTGCD